MDFETWLKETVEEAESHHRVTVSTILDEIDDGADYSDSRIVGRLEGAAAALDKTVRELLDEYRVA